MLLDAQYIFVKIYLIISIYHHYCNDKEINILEEYFEQLGIKIL